MDFTLILNVVYAINQCWSTFSLAAHLFCYHLETPATFKVLIVFSKNRINNFRTLSSAPIVSSIT